MNFKICIQEVGRLQGVVEVDAVVVTASPSIQIVRLCAAAASSSIQIVRLCAATASPYLQVAQLYPGCPDSLRK